MGNRGTAWLTFTKRADRILMSIQNAHDVACVPVMYLPYFLQSVL